MAVTKMVGLSLVTLGVVILSGCVRTRVVVTSDPPGADVVMNRSHLGSTPVERPITWYWFYDFSATKEGYEPTTVRRRFRAPPWLWPGFDLVMEAMPFKIVDEKHVHIVMEKLSSRPQPEVATK